MSPTEDDLRRALSDGAGDTPNAGRIVALARSRRDQRRKRVLSAAAAVVVVGGIATGGTFLARSDDSTESAGNGGGNAAGGGAVHNAPAASEPTASGNAGLNQPAPSVCPSSIPPVATNTVPSGDTTHGKLFAQPVASLEVCAYPSTATGSIAGGSTSAPATPSSVRLTGSDATTLVDSLENASTTASRGMCPAIRSASQETIVVLPRTADGTLLSAVTTTINEVPCAVVVSNGTAVRYAWTPPAALARQFEQLAPNDATGSATQSTPGQPPNRVNGSPAH